LSIFIRLFKKIYDDSNVVSGNYRDAITMMTFLRHTDADITR